MPEIVEGGESFIPDHLVEVRRHAEGAVARERRRGYETTLGKLGLGWISPDLLSLNRALQRRIEPKAEVILPEKVESFLPALFSFLSATESRAFTEAKATIEGRGAKANLEMSAEGITLSLHPPVEDKEIVGIQEGIKNLEESYHQFKEKWEDIIGKAASGDRESIHLLVGGIGECIRKKIT